MIHKLLIPLFLILSLFSCRTIHKKAETPQVAFEKATDTTKVITEEASEKVKSLSTAKLINKIVESELTFHNLEIPKVNINYESGNNAFSLRGSIKLTHDSVLQISVTKLNISLAKAKMTPDSVFFINYLDRSYFKGSYAELNESFHTELSFGIVQSIITNSLFSTKEEIDNKDFKNLFFIADSSEFILSSIKPKKLDNILKNEKRLQRIINHSEDSTFMVQSFHINPQNYKIEKINLKDLRSQRELNVGFDQFEDIGNGVLFPAKVEVNTITQKNQSKVLLELNRFEIDKPINFNFNIPANYRRIERLR
ncbi:MAG: DUF4292 domain-containing protein [Bacteroidota bacterium]|nr:DUF4292 domain-containing protein [Bacteroidota bacterium]MDP4204572.1 DUF4292 domain-containing protein [Bacteroidota bacterium]